MRPLGRVPRQGPGPTQRGLQPGATSQLGEARAGRDVTEAGGARACVTAGCPALRDQLLPPGLLRVLRARVVLGAVSVGGGCASRAIGKAEGRERRGRVAGGRGGTWTVVSDSGRGPRRVKEGLRDSLTFA